MSGCVANFRRNPPQTRVQRANGGVRRELGESGAPVVGIGDGVGAALRSGTLGLGLSRVAGSAVWRFIGTADAPHFRPRDRPEIRREANSSAGDSRSRGPRSGTDAFRGIIEFWKNL